jgi:hypothetical protein
MATVGDKNELQKVSCYVAQRLAKHCLSALVNISTSDTEQVIVVAMLETLF